MVDSANGGREGCSAIRAECVNPVALADLPAACCPALVSSRSGPRGGDRSAAGTKADAEEAGEVKSEKVFCFDGSVTRSCEE